MTLQWLSLTKWRCLYKTPSPPPCFWQLAPSKPPTDSPLTGPFTWPSLDGGPPPWVYSSQLGLDSGCTRTPAKTWQACFCEYAQIYIMENFSLPIYGDLYFLYTSVTMSVMPWLYAFVYTTDGLHGGCSKMHT